MINKLVIKLNGTFPIVMFIISFLTILFIYKALLNEKEYISVGLGMAVFMFLYYQTSLNLVRQSLAISIGIYAITCLAKEKYIKFIIYVFLATLFHKSALICLIVLLIKNIIEDDRKRIRKYSIFLIALFLVIRRDIMGNMVMIIFKSSYYSRYFTRDIASETNIVNFFMRIIPFILIYFVVCRGCKIKPFTIYYNLCIIGYILSLLGIFTATYVQRISYYFTYLSIILLPYCAKNYRRKYRKIFWWLIIGIIMFFWLYDFFYKGYSETVPYRTIFYK